MTNAIHIFSDNTYFHNTLKELIEDSGFMNYNTCSGNVVVIDTGGITKVEDIVWPVPVCHILFVISREAHKSFLSSFEWNVSVSYLSSKCSPDELINEVQLVVSNLKRRITCKAFYNVVTNESLTQRELKMTTAFMCGKPIDKISKEFNLNYKTVANYRSAIIFKSFGKLDIKGVRVFNLSQSLSKDYMKHARLRFNVNGLYDCPIQ